MAPAHGISVVLLFCVKFLLLVSVLTAGWWWLLPYYGWVLIQISGGILRYAMGLPVEAGRIIADGVLNTTSQMVFVVDGAEIKARITVVITNVPVYWALILATSQLTLRRRAVISLTGTLILVSSHVLFIVFSLGFSGVQFQASSFYTAVVQFFITLPFLLWIILAYWERLAGALKEDNER